MWAAGARSWFTFSPGSQLFIKQPIGNEMVEVRRHQPHGQTGPDSQGGSQGCARLAAMLQFGLGVGAHFGMLDVGLMMVIRVTCAGCGDVELKAVDMRVRRCVQTGEATYVFTCPDCHMAEVRHAEDHVVEVLRSAGVTCAEWQLPAELAEAHSGPPLTHDDLLDFHEGLSAPDWFESLRAITDR